MKAFRSTCSTDAWPGRANGAWPPAKQISGWLICCTQFINALVLIVVTVLASATSTAFALDNASITVKLGPVDILPAEASWRVDDGPWHPSEGTVAGLSAGTHTVSFQAAVDWTAPSPRNVVLEAGQALELRASYRQLLLPNGVYFGVAIDWALDDVDSISLRLGREPAVYSRFIAFPCNEGDLITLDNTISSINTRNGILMLTLEPFTGLASVTSSIAESFAQWLGNHSRQGTQVFIRFAHEMNGAWYPWGQRPTEYRNTFRMLAEAVHYHAPRAYMLWAPTYGEGYPYELGAHTYMALPGTDEFNELDTNHDGILTMQDDCYGPFYPGDDSVDWVGFSVYHWGNTYPWEENEIPETSKFAAIITGEYNGANGDFTILPDFYGEYAVGHNKPMAIVETSALYNTTRIGEESELDIKQNWWRQVFHADIRADFPKLMMVNWFEHRKPEAEIGGSLIDWTLGHNPLVLQAFLADIAGFNWLLFGPDVEHPSPYGLPVGGGMPPPPEPEGTEASPPPTNPPEELPADPPPSTTSNPPDPAENSQPEAPPSDPPQETTQNPPSSTATDNPATQQQSGNTQASQLITNNPKPGCAYGMNFTMLFGMWICMAAIKLSGRRLSSGLLAETAPIRDRSGLESRH